MTTSRTDSSDAPELVLAIECAAGPLSVAIYDGGRFRSSVLGRGERAKAEELNHTVEQALHLAGLSPLQVSRVAVSNGPGSFTGIRSGVAFARGFAAAGHATVSLFSLTRAMTIELGSSGTRAALVKTGRNEAILEVFTATGKAQSNKIDLDAAEKSLAPILAGYGDLAMILDPRIPVESVKEFGEVTIATRSFAEYLALSASDFAASADLQEYLSNRF